MNADAGFKALSDAWGWVYGYRISADHIRSEHGAEYNVDARKICRNTFEKDKDGNPIFEGDVLSDAENDYIVRYRSGAFVGTGNRGELPLSSCAPGRVVTGNIFNPEPEKEEKPAQKICAPSCPICGERMSVYMRDGKIGGKDELSFACRDAQHTVEFTGAGTIDEVICLWNEKRGVRHGL